MVVGSCNAHFWGLDRETGDRIWAYDISQDGDQLSFHGEMHVDQAGVVIGTDTPSGHFYAFDVSAGQVTWKLPVDSGVGSDIVASVASVYGVSHSDELLCVDRKTGALQWSFDSRKKPQGRKPEILSPALLGNRIVLPGFDGKIYALDAVTGKKRWARKLGGSPSTSILASHGALYVGTDNNELHRLDPKSGKVLATLVLQLTPRDDMAATDDALLLRLEGSTGRRLVGAQRSAFIAVKPDLTEVIWSRYPEDQSRWTSHRPYISRDQVVAGTLRGQVTALSLTDGQPAWFLEVSDVVTVIGGADELLLVGTQGGSLHALDWPIASRR